MKGSFESELSDEDDDEVEEGEDRSEEDVSEAEDGVASMGGAGLAENDNFVDKSWAMVGAFGSGAAFVERGVRRYVT